jgi:hypothetical protein
MHMAKKDEKDNSASKELQSAPQHSAVPAHFDELRTMVRGFLPTRLDAALLPA